MKINLYTNTSDMRILNKKMNMIQKGIECKIKDNISVYNPVFIISEKNIDSFFSSVNYVRCTDLGRYYYITDIVMITGNRVEIHCECDVLMSFASYIRNSPTCVIERQEIHSTPYVTDEKMTLSNQKSYTQYNFSGSPFSLANINSDGKCIALTVTGGV